jgi:drug/metabolite transporter (DMT)-like permease
LTAPAWLWLPIVLWAALAQTARNAAQRSLVAQAGTLGATLARFLYGIPFAALWVALLHLVPATAAPLPHFHFGYFGWLLLGALGQIAATVFLLSAMKQRNFVVGVAYSKTDALQVALFGSVFLRELPGGWTLVAIALATAGVVMLSLPQKPGAVEGSAWTSRAAWFGLASGAGFALSAVGYRGAALQLPESSAWTAGAWACCWPRHCRPCCWEAGSRCARRSPFARR